MATRVLPTGQVVNVPQTGLVGAEQALQGGLGGALGAVASGAGAAGQLLDPFIQQGTGAFTRQAELAGAAGVGAQKTAFDEFVESPAQQFLRQQGEQAVLRNSSATGGLGGGNVLKELQRQGVGLAAQDLQNQFARLNSLSSIGAGAAGQGAGIAQRAGEIGAQAFLGTGQQLAAGRTRAGEQIAGAVGGTGSALADLVARQGAGVSDVLGQASGSVADLIATEGREQGQSQIQLANLLANIATGTGGQVAGLPTLPSLTPKTGALGGLGKAASGIGTLIGSFKND